MTDNSPAQACAEPGCTGVIEDGYCNVCGTPAPASAASSMPISAPASAKTPGSTASSTGAVSRSTGAVAGAVVGAASTRQSTRTSSSRLASASLGSARSNRTRRVGTSSTRLRSQRLGGGVTTVPPAVVADPMTIVMADPQLAENKRQCPSCGGAVGRSRDGQPGRTSGFCPHCGASFDFAPQLHAADLVGGQYEVVGAIAHGGLGWIYLARDKNVSDQWVVLKGLLNTGDKDAYDAAVAERTFLAKVAHPLIVKIINFAEFEGAGYTVMEYVGGTSLKQILKDRTAKAGHPDPLPVDQALAYTLEILPAFAYLHDQQLLFCDFKPDNLIHQGEGLKLIDLGAVRHLDDEDSAIYGTVGYQAPEIGDEAPSVESDIYTIGRTLVTLAIDFRGNTSTYAASLPPVDNVPVFARYDSFYRLVSKACATNPNDRFGSADEMRAQVLGVLREVVAIDRAGDAAADTSATSVNFEAPMFDGAKNVLSWRELPALRVDPSDPMATWLAGVTDTAALASAPQETVEVTLARIRADIGDGNLDDALTKIAQVLADDAWEWRAVWLQGLVELSRDRPAEARACFNAVYGQVPGELAPKLALAASCELSGEPAIAEQLYLVCARTDANYAAPAAFGLARLRSAQNDANGAVDALGYVSSTRSSYPLARIQRARVQLTSATDLPGLDAALASISGAAISDTQREQVRMLVYSKALEHVLRPATGKVVTSDQTVGGVPAAEAPLRAAMESSCRSMAKLTDDPQQRIALIDQANAVRPRTLT